MSNKGKSLDSNVFYMDIMSIRDINIREFTEKAVKLIPQYFYEVPASSSGKYHPKYALGEGGLLRHVQATLKIAKSLFNAFTLTPYQEDIIIASLILHDGWKCGDGVIKESDTILHTAPNHAEYAVNELSKLIDGTWEQYHTDILSCINSHMGKWSTTPLQYPNTVLQRTVHLIDYLASRKFLEVVQD